MSIALGQVAHFSLAVTEPTASAEWWLSLFDLEEWARSASRVVLGNDAIVMSLIKGTPDPSALTHMAFRTRDMASLKSAAIRASRWRIQATRSALWPRAPPAWESGFATTTGTAGSCTLQPKTSHELMTSNHFSDVGRGMPFSVSSAMIGA
jgi:hypothetical protein